MPKQVDVLVRDISKDEQGRPSQSFGHEQTLSYKTFLMLTSSDPERFELLGEVDSKGDLVPGSPNLNAQHRRTIPQSQRSAEPVVNSGPTQKEIEQAKEIERLKSQIAQPPVKERKKPGPKKKDVVATEAPVEA